jgi:hypothetical protein
LDGGPPALSDQELEIFELEGGGLGVASGFDVFARTTKEEETNEAHVSDGLFVIGGGSFPHASDE